MTRQPPRRFALTQTVSCKRSIWTVFCWLCQSRSSANSRQICVSTSCLSGADYCCSSLPWEWPPGTVCSLTSAGHDAGWGWVSRGCMGGPRGWAYSQWPCVCVCGALLVHKTRSLFAFWRLCKSWSHGSWSTAHAGYAAVTELHQWENLVYIDLVHRPKIIGLLLLCVCIWSPERKPGMSDVIPLSEISGLSFESFFLSPLSFFCLTVFLFFLSCHFHFCWWSTLTFFQKILLFSLSFLSRVRLFCTRQWFLLGS